MITKAIIHSRIGKYLYKVRIPILDKSAFDSRNTHQDFLREASVCSHESSYPNYKAGDIVFIAFENDDKANPVILGYLSCDKQSLSEEDFQLGSLEVLNATKLSKDTSIGKITPENILQLAGCTDNIQSSLNNLSEGKQNKLIAGSNITIENNVISASGGGGGSSDYNDLTNKPQINSIELIGDLHTEDLNLDYQKLVNLPVNVSEFINDAEYQSQADVEEAITEAISTKQNKLTPGTNIVIENDIISAIGSGGTSDYEQLTNKPQINNIPLSKTTHSADLNISYQDLQDRPSAYVVDHNLIISL